MAATQTKLRRGTSAQVLAMTPAEAEAVVDLSNDRLCLGDGVTPGGIIIPNAFDMQLNSFGFAVAGGTANAITATLTPAISSYVQPLSIKIKISTTNTTATTINLNGLGTRNIYKVSSGILSPLVAGDLIAGTIYELVYDGTQFQILGGVGGIVTVKQGDLSTATGTFSGFVTITQNYGGTLINNVVGHGATNLTSPGGAFGLSIESYMFLGTYACGFLIGNKSTSYSFDLLPWASSASAAGAVQVFGRQTYITASPPYDLGDGEVGGFIFLLIDSNGQIVSHYAADTPPWAYNGPTDVKATHECKVTGKKFNRVMKKRSFEEIMDGAPIEYRMKEITHKVKNADMELIPHPFGTVPEGHHVVMLDPMDEKVSRIIEYQNSGGWDWTESLTNGKIQIGEECKRCGPNGVHVHKMKYKYTKKF